MFFKNLVTVPLSKPVKGVSNNCPICQNSEITTPPPCIRYSKVLPQVTIDYSLQTVPYYMGAPHSPILCNSGCPIKYGTPGDKTFSVILML